VYQNFTTVALQQYELNFWSVPANLTVDLNLGIDILADRLLPERGMGICSIRPFLT
jgi:hypothetical protein